MEDTSKTIIATITPERVPGFEMEFTKDKTGVNYVDDFEATLTLKIGKDARKITFNKSSKYHSSEYGELPDGTRGLLKDSWTEELIGVDPYTHPFEDLEKVGVEVDMTEFVEEYKNKLPGIMAEQKAIELERFEKAYKSSWIHQGAITLKASKKFKPEVTVIKSEMGTPEKHSYPYNAITLKYREESVTITLEYVSPHRYGSREMRYKMDGRVIPGYNGRYYRTLETCLVKFIAMVDEKLAIAKAKLTHEEKEQAERNAKRNRIAEDLGYAVIITKEWKSGNSYGRRRGDGYYDYSYYLVLKPEKKNAKGDTVEEGRRLKVWESYRNESAKPEDRKYSIGLGELTPTQIKGIITILISE